MACQLVPCLTCHNSPTMTTQCGCTFHLECLQTTWFDQCHVCLPCPCCSTELGQAHQDSQGQMFVGIDAGDQWIAFYTIIDNQISLLNQHFTLWKRQGTRLEKHESINIRKHIVVT